MELRAKNPALFDDIERRRDHLQNRMAKAFTEHQEIHAAKETGAAITNYHQNVVMPIVRAIVGELVALQCELALWKSQAE